MDNYCLTETNTGQGIYSLTQQLSFDSSATPTQLIYVRPCDSVLSTPLTWGIEFFILFFIFSVIFGSVLYLGKKLL